MLVHVEARTRLVVFLAPALRASITSVQAHVAAREVDEGGGGKADSERAVQVVGHPRGDAEA